MKQETKNDFEDVLTAILLESKTTPEAYENIRELEDRIVSEKASIYNAKLDIINHDEFDYSNGLGKG